MTLKRFLLLVAVVFAGGWALALLVVACRVAGG